MSEPVQSHHEGPVVVSVQLRALNSPTSMPGQILTNHEGNESAQLWSADLVPAVTTTTDPNRHVSRATAFAATNTIDSAAVASPLTPAAAAVIESVERQGQLIELLGPSAAAAIRDARAEGLPVRVELVASPTDPVLCLPWEYLRTLNEPIALTEGCSIARRITSTDQTPVPQERPDQLTTAALNLADWHDTTFDEAIEVLEQLRDDDVLVDLAAVHEVDVLHILGHGVAPDPATGRAATIQGLDAPTLSAHLDEVGWPDLIVLIACQSAVNAASTSSFAGELIDAGATAVIAMAGDIETTSIAPRFLGGLWQHLDRGGSLHAAICQGRVDIALNGTLQQWGIPTLFTAVSDPLPSVEPVEPDVIGRDTVLARITATLEIGDHAQVGRAIGVVHSGAPTGDITSTTRVGEYAQVDEIIGVEHKA